MKQFIITRNQLTWLRVEYFVKEVDKDSSAERVMLRAVYKQSWKIQMDVYEAEGATKSTLFSIKARAFLGLDYDVVDSEGSPIGTLVHESLFSQSWRVVDLHRDVTAQLVGIALFLCEGRELIPNGPIVCEMRDEGGFFDECFTLYCHDESALNINLILALCILALSQRRASGNCAGV